MTLRSGQCKVAVIGAGNMAREHIRAFSDVPGVTIAGIHSRTRHRAEGLASEFGVPRTYDSIEELYEGTEADLVLVTVSETAMNPVCRTSFEFPWVALIEKPAGIDPSDVEDLCRLAKEKRRRAFVALNRRFYSSTRAAIEHLALRPGPRFVKVQDQEDQGQARASGSPEVVVRNWMYANSIHLIDYFRIFGRGRITTIKPVISWDPMRPWIVVAEIGFESGDIGLYEAIWNGPGPWAVSVSTSEVRWEMRPLEQAFIQPTGKRRQDPVPVHPWDQAFKPGLRLQAEMMVAETLGRPSGVPTLEEALDTLRLIQAIFTP